MVSASVIDDFTEDYQHSEEERLDLIRIYKEHKGDVELIMECMLGSSYTDEPRFIKMIENEIKENGLMCYKKFITDCSKASRSKRLQAAQEERKEFDEFEKAEAEDEEKSLKELKMAIQKRGSDSIAHVTSIIEKKFKKDMLKDEKFEEPSDEVFAALQAKLFGKKI